MRTFLLLSTLALVTTVVAQTPSRTVKTGPTGSVSYGGVSFNFDKSLAEEVEADTIPASLDGKPSDIWPAHPRFTLVDYPRPRTLHPRDPHIRVFSVKEFREAVDIASKKDARSVIYPPNWTIYFDEEVRVLKALLASRPQGANVGRFLAKVRGKTSCSVAMPFLPMWEACQAFVAHVNYVNFEHGKGVFFLTQWDTETTQIANDGLEYAFQGITDDGKYYVYAEFAVAAPGLPRGDEPEVMKWNMKNYLLSHQSKQYLAYQRPVVAKLEALPGDRFQPKLRLLEQLIESIRAEIKLQ